MEAEQTTGSHPGPSQAAAVSAQLSLGTKGTDTQQLLSITRGSHTQCSQLKQARSSSSSLRTNLFALGNICHFLK